MRESVVMYVSTYSAILKRISSVEQREAIFEAIFNYAFYDEPIQEFGNPVADAIMDMVKPLIDSNNKNYVNGCKGGRPKKNETDEAEPSVKTTGKNHRLKPSVEPSGKGNVNEDKNVNENDNADSHLHFTKDEDAPAPPADAGAAHSPFTFADVKDCAEENDIDLTERQLSNFYSWMEKYDWTINGRRVTKLENALSGYAKKHQKSGQEEPEKLKSSTLTNHLKTFKIWLRYHNYEDYSRGYGDFDDEILVDEDVMKVVFEVEDLKESMENINGRLMDEGFGKEDIKPLMKLFQKWVNEKNAPR